MAKKGSKNARGKVAATARRPEAGFDEEQILRKATLHLIRKEGGLLVATAARAEAGDDGTRHWVITVTLRHPTGHEGYIGDLMYDGASFTFRTPPEVRQERARKIGEDPEHLKRWDEHRASPLPAGKE